MKAILAIARTEVLKNWTLIAVPLATVIGVLVLSLSGTRVSDQDFRGSLMGILILLEFPLAAVPAAMLGLNLFGPDLRQRKLAFFLTRPCAPWQLWAGRLLGALLIISVGWVGGAVVVPFNGASNVVTGGWRAALFFAAVLACLLLLMNALAMILAANASRWFIADLIAALVFLAAVIWSFDRALPFQTGDYVQAAGYAIGAGPVVALFFGGLAFLSYGRGDGALGHRAQSLTLWSFAALMIVSMGVYRAWERSRPIGSLFSSGSATAVGPAQALVSTYYGRGRSTFLLDTTEGSARRISWFAGGWFSSAVRPGRLAYLEPRFDPTAGPDLLAPHLVISSLDPDRPPLLDWPVPERLRRLLDVSEDAGLAMFTTEAGIEAIRTSTGDPRFRYSAASVRWARFQGEETIVAMVEESPSVARLSVLTLDGKVVQERKFPLSQTGYWEAKLHSDSGRVAITEGRLGVTLFEKDGAVIVRLAPEPGQIGVRTEAYTAPTAVLFTRTGDFLLARRGGLIVVRHDEGTVREVPFTSEGKPLASGRGRLFSGELESGEIVLFERDVLPFIGTDSSWRLGSSFLADPSTGALRLILPKHRPLDSESPWGGVISHSSPSRDASLRLFENEEGDIVFLDPGSVKPRLLVKSTMKGR